MQESIKSLELNFKLQNYSCCFVLKIYLEKDGFWIRGKISKYDHLISKPPQSMSYSTGPYKKEQGAIDFILNYQKEIIKENLT